ncbi:hypothetical protein COOONC_07787 [Cooperia oncophora]
MVRARNKKYKSTELAILLGLLYDDWSGVPIKSLLTSSELKRFESGQTVWGSLKLDVLAIPKSVSTKTSEEVLIKEVHQGRKRGID